MFKSKNILVTGGCGFIGSNFIRYMIKEYDDINIYNIDKLTYAGSKKNLEDVNQNERYHFFQIDICNYNSLVKILNENDIDTVVHFAAESHVDRSIMGAKSFIETNILGTFYLLEAVKNSWGIDSLSNGKFRFHHISTDEVYGSLNANEKPFSENNKYFPNSPYSASKASSDHLVRAWSETYNIPVTISNCSNNYGKYQHKEKLIPVVINACKYKKEIPIYGTGLNIRDWLHVKDHCRAIDRILKDGNVNEIYNIGGDCEKTNIEVVNLICSHFDIILPQKGKYSDLITFVEDRQGHDFRYSINSTKIMSNLQWSPQINFDDGIKDTIDLYLRNSN